MTVSIVTKEEITKLLNDWYSEIRSHHVTKAKELKTEIDKKIHRIEEDQDILIYYSLLDFRFQMLTGNFQDDLSLSENHSEQTETFLQYYYHLFKFIYYTEISHYSQAKKHCENAGKLLEAIPDEAEKAEFNYRASLFYYYIGQDGAAVVHATKAKYFFSNNLGYEIKHANCHNTLGMACIRLRQFELAEKHLTASLNILREQNNNTLMSLILKTNYNLGLLYADQNLSELAIQYLSESFEDTERDYKTMFLLAREYFKLGNIDRAETYIQKGLKVCNIEYKHHFNILRAMNDDSPIEQLEKNVVKAIDYFKKEELWQYVKTYTEELANRFFVMKNDKKSSVYFHMSYEARKNY